MSGTMFEEGTEQVQRINEAERKGQATAMKALKDAKDFEDYMYLREPMRNAQLEKTFANYSEEAPPELTEAIAKEVIGGFTPEERKTFEGMSPDEQLTHIKTKAFNKTPEFTKGSTPVMDEAMRRAGVPESTPRELQSEKLPEGEGKISELGKMMSGDADYGQDYDDPGRNALGGVKQGIQKFGSDLEMLDDYIGSDVGPAVKDAYLGVGGMIAAPFKMGFDALSEGLRPSMPTMGLNLKAPSAEEYYAQNPNRRTGIEMSELKSRQQAEAFMGKEKFKFGLKSEGARVKSEADMLKTLLAAKNKKSSARGHQFSRQEKLDKALIDKEMSQIVKMKDFLGAPDKLKQQNAWASLMNRVKSTVYRQQIADKIREDFPALYRAMRDKQKKKK